MLNRSSIHSRTLHRAPPPMNFVAYSQCSRFRFYTHVLYGTYNTTLSQRDMFGTRGTCDGGLTWLGRLALDKITLAWIGCVPGPPLAPALAISHRHPTITHDVAGIDNDGEHPWPQDATVSADVPPCSALRFACAVRPDYTK